MPRYLKINIICILFLVFTVPASSELYQFKDKNGNTRLTDNIYSVPLEYRSQLEQYSEIESVPDEMEIQPLKNKPLPQVKTEKVISPLPQVKTEKVKAEKVISPKTSKAISATTEKNIIPPSIPLDTGKKTATPPPQKTTPPIQPIISEKTVQVPDTKLLTHEIYKSNRVIINKKTMPSEKTAKALPTEDLKEKTEPLSSPKTAPEIKKESELLTERIITKQTATKPETKKTTQSKTVTDDQKTVTAPKIAQAEAEKAIKKSAIPDTKKPEIKLPDTTEKIFTEIQKEEPRLPEKTAEITSAPKMVSPTAEKKEIIEKDIITDTKTNTAQNILPVLPENNVIKKNQSDANKETVPAIKIVKKAPTENIIANQTAPKTESKTETIKSTLSKDVTADQKTVTASKTIHTAPEIAPQKTKPDILKNPAMEIEKEINIKSDIVANDQTAPKTENIVLPTENVVSDKINEKDKSLILAQLETTKSLLAERKEALNRIYLNLMKEKQEIENSVNEEDEKSILQYNENVKKLNFKIKHYKKKKKILQVEIERYNDTIKQSILN